ncbi:hypothetical protein [Streptomyces sp. YIM S03343]
MTADQERERTQFADLVSARMRELGLSLRRLEQLAIDPKSDPGEPAEPLWKRGTLDNLIKGRRIKPPTPAMIRALAVGLEVSEDALKVAIGKQFYDVDTLRTGDGQVRAFIRGFDELSPEDQAKVRAHMDAHRPVRDT